jgi:3-oxoacyl-[acyl-carrier protein] reductase
MQRLAEKIALITGGSRGIGAAIARRLAADGAGVVVNYASSRPAAEAVVQSIVDSGGKAVAMPADLGDLKQITPLVDATIQQFGRLDILVNNAAFSDRRPLEQIDPENYAKQFDLNVRGLLFTIQAAAKHMAAGGRIINITSGIVRVRTPAASVYAATKAAVEAITRCLAAELGPRQITVNSVAPGITDTDMLQSFMPQAVQKALVSQTPLGRVGTPEDIADAVAFVASDEARWITGEVIPVNGGLG